MLFADVILCDPEGKKQGNLGSGNLLAVFARICTEGESDTCTRALINVDKAAANKGLNCVESKANIWAAA